MTMFAIKIHRQQGICLLAACDEEVLGKTFAEGNLRLKVGEGFYKDEIVGESDLTDCLASYDNMNLVGNETVNIAIREGHVDRDCVITINGVMHAQVLR